MCPVFHASLDCELVALSLIHICNRITKGYVIGFAPICDYDAAKIKEILDISRDSVAIEGKLLALAAWMKEQYGGTMIQALKTVLPIKQKENARIRKRIRLLLSEEAVSYTHLDVYKRQGYGNG